MVSPLIFRDAARRDSHRRCRRRRPPAACTAAAAACTCVPERSLAGFCREQCDVAVASIYVNPTQFSKNEDFGVYPRSEARCVLS